MTRRKLVIGIAAAAMFGVLVVPASAELHRVSVTLVTGETRTVTVDVPEGSTVESAQIPGVRKKDVQSITDLGPVTTPSPEPTATETETAEPDPTKTPKPTPTKEPTKEPTEERTREPTKEPTREPTRDHTRDPAPQPSQQPAQQPGGTGAPAGSATPAAQAPEKSNGSKGSSRKAPRVVGDDRAVEPHAEALNGEIEDTVGGAKKRVDRSNPTQNTDGTPTLANPTVSIAVPGPAPIGVPNFFIEKFRIPPFLLPIYQAAGIEYGVRWEVLAAINEIETDYGRNLNVSSAGALGWMQFMPASWEMYGVDGNHDGLKDPYNPVDAIFSAARYLRAAGANTDLRAAIFAYNHADWYVDSVMLRARLIGGLPADLVGSLSGLTQGRFPVLAKAAYAQQVKRRHLRNARGRDNAAYVVDGDGRRKGIRIFARRGAPVVAVNDGRIARVGHSRRLGRFVVLQDVYGNAYTYAHLKSTVKSFPTPKRRRLGKRAIARELRLPTRDEAPTRAASVTSRAESEARTAARARKPARTRKDAKRRRAEAPVKERLFANPHRPNASLAAGDRRSYGRSEDFAAYLDRVFGLDRADVDMKPLKRGARVTAGTILGHVGRISKRTAPHLLFEIRPAGRGAPRIDPKPILDGWKLLESTAIYRAKGRNPLVGDDAETPSIGQILLMNKEALAERVLTDPNIQIYECGRRDIRAGQIDRRVLATLEFLAASGLEPTVTSLRCGHSYYTSSGNVSEHTTGTAVDIAAINGVPIMDHQGPGSIAELTIQRLLTLQGTMKPHQIISLMTFKDTDNTFAMGDHADHIHVGFRPLYGLNRKTAKQVDAILEPQQWIKLIDRLGEIDNPTVARKPSDYAVEATKRASAAHKGE
jgi:soluble lytic murein transglycosylase-like protein